MARKVLIVDKDPSLLDSLEREFALHKEIFSVIKITGNKEAVQVFKEHFVSLVVLELNQSDEDGVKLLTHMRTIYPDVPVVVISEDKSAEILGLVKRKGGTALVTKPFHADDLGKILLNLLQKEADGGTMRNVSPTVFLQLMEMESRTCTIRIIDKNTQNGGILYFREGQLVDARLNRSYGIDAAYVIFGWENVTLYIENDCPARENVINSPLQPIIMKAVTLKDHVDEKVSPPSAIEQSAAKVSRSPGKMSVPATRPIPAQPKQRVKPLSFMDKVRMLLKNEFGSRVVLEDIYEDRGMARAVKTVSELQNIFDFGPLKMVYVQSGQAVDRIILAADEPTVVDVNARGQEENIIKVLSKHL